MANYRTATKPSEFDRVDVCLNCPQEFNPWKEKWVACPQKRATRYRILVRVGGLLQGYRFDLGHIEKIDGTWTCDGAEFATPKGAANYRWRHADIAQLNRERREALRRKYAQSAARDLGEALEIMTRVVGVVADEQLAKLEQLVRVAHIDIVDVFRAPTWAD
jgi:hypothetical protein